MNIVITGATKGIGRAIAEKFAAEGFNLAVCARSQDDLNDMQEAFAKDYPNCQFISKATDVSNAEAVNEFGDLVLEKFDKIEVLVNNAGVFIPGEVHKEEEGMLEKQIETNLYSAYRMTRKVIPRMQENKDGHVFNMCSTASVVAYPNGGSYCISKFALLGFSKVLREEMKIHNVRVTSLLPGATYTASWEGTDLPKERFIKAEDIGNLVYGTWELSKQTVIEEIMLRPQLGDLG